MYTIYMDDNGELVSNRHQKLYQNETMHEEILFILPKMYGELETQLFTVSFKYVTPGTNTTRLEILELDDDNYRDKYVSYVLPVTTKISHEKGIVSGYLTLEYSEPAATSGDDPIIHIGHSTTINIKIEAVTDYFTDSDTLNAIDRQIAQLNTLLSSTTSVNNIVIDGDSVYLTNNGVKVGDVQTITHPEVTNN